MYHHNFQHRIVNSEEKILILETVLNSFLVTDIYQSAFVHVRRLRDVFLLTIRDVNGLIDQFTT